MTANRFWQTGLAAVLWLAGASAAEAAKKGTFNMALRYALQESVSSTAPNLPPDLLELPVRLVVVDSRAGADPAVIGDSTDDDHAWPVRATNDVAAWAQEVLEKNAADWGIRTAADAPRTLTFRITRFHINESNKAVGSTYTADVKLGHALRDDTGRVLAEGTAEGGATRYGKKRSADNASEVLSDAIKETFAAVFGDPALQDAWRGKTRPGGAAPAGPAIAPAALLDELVQLQKRGFTTDLLVSYVQGRNLSAPLSADDMVRWKEAGLPQEVIKAALDRAP